MEYVLEHWIAFLALAISVLLLWRDYLQPFRIVARPAGRVTIAKNPFSAALTEDCIVMDVIFENQGARRGVVEDVALSVHSGSRRGIFRSLAIQRDRSLNLTKGLPQPTLETFLSFGLGKGEVVVRRVLFVPYGNALTLAPGEYSATVWVRSTEGESWKKGAVVQFPLDQEDAQVLARSTATPDSGGGQFVAWLTRDKVLTEVETKLKELQELLKEPK